jgi:hypothetical protein
MATKNCARMGVVEKTQHVAAKKNSNIQKI